MQEFMNLLYPYEKANRAKQLWRLVIPIIGIHLAIVLPLAFILNIWFDEAYTLNTTGRGLSYALSQSIHFEEQAPFYFISLALWRTLNDSIEFSRLFSIICTVLTLCLIPKLSQKFIPEVSPLLTTTIAALNPFLIWAALEIRLYAFSTLLSALLLLWFHDGYLQNPPRRSSRWFYIGTAIVAIYTHYFLGLLLIANGLAVLCQKQWRVLRFYLRDMIIVGIAGIPIVLIILNQFRSLSDNVLPGESQNLSFLFVKGLQKAVGMFFLYILPAPTPEDWAVFRFSLFLGLIGLMIWYHRSLNLRLTEVKRLSLVLITGSLIGAFVAVFTLIPDLHYRHTTGLFIPSLLVVIALLSTSKSYRRLIPVATIIILGLSMMSLNITYAALAKPGDYRRVATYLMVQEQSYQPILVFNAEVDMVLKYYYQGANVLLPLPKALNFQRFAWKDLMLQNPQEIEGALANTSEQAATIWLVKDTKTLKEQPNYAPSYEILEHYIEQNYRTIQQKDFYGSSVQQLQRL